LLYTFGTQGSQVAALYQPVAAVYASNRLLIPEILYGREREIGTLLASFDRVVTNGTPELVLVSGHAGIGKKASQRA
jgi:predicted ATP-dependent serine protease